MEALGEDELGKDLEEVFAIEEKLGEGAYGSVFRGVHKKSKASVALKQVHVDTKAVATDTWFQETIKEICMLQLCSNEHVVKYFGSFYKAEDLWIIMEYCKAGSVLDLMRRRRTVMTELQISTILRGALAGLEYLHGERKMHRDIKAGNILLSEAGVPKLADLGVAGELENSLSKRNTVIGTPFWMAPEVIQENGGYDEKADIWSLGITIIEMAEGAAPLAEVHPMRAIFMIPSKPPPTLTCPEEWGAPLIEFVSLCLVKEPTDRKSAEHLLGHPFITAAPPPATLMEIIEAAQSLTLDGDDAGGIGGAEGDTGTVVPGGGGAPADGTVVIRGASADDGTVVIRGRPVVAADDAGTMVINQDDAGTMVVTGGADAGADTGTMVVGTGVIDNNDYGTVVVGGQDDGTFVNERPAPADYKPAFMQHIEANEAKEAKEKGNAPTPSPVEEATALEAPSIDMSREELLKRRSLIEAGMVAELKKLRAGYKTKRTLIEEAIAQKQAPVATGSGTQTPVEGGDAVMDTSALREAVDQLGSVAPVGRKVANI